MLILKSKKEPSKERPCSALGEELCYHSHNGNGKID